MIEFESCQSLEKLVLDDEICGYVHRVATGIDVTEETLANQIFQESVAKGHFLSQKHTVRWLRREQYIPVSWLTAGIGACGELSVGLMP